MRSSTSADFARPEYRNSIRSKTAIRKAFAELLMQKDFDDISVSDIIKGADISRATFYAHFESPRDVLKALVESAIDEVSLLLEPLKSPLGKEEVLRNLDRITDYIKKHLDYVKALSKAERRCGLFLEIISMKEEWPKGSQKVLPFIIAGSYGIYTDAMIIDEEGALDDARESSLKMIRALLEAAVAE